MLELAPVNLHGSLAGAELRRDLLVEQARHDQRHDFAFPLRQRFIPPSQLGQLCSLLSHRAVPSIAC
jgi:hypothetical protein